MLEGVQCTRNGRLQRSTKIIVYIVHTYTHTYTRCNDMKICFLNDYENGCQSLEKQISVEKFLLLKVFTPGLAMLKKLNYQDT